MDRSKIYGHMDPADGRSKTIHHNGSNGDAVSAIQQAIAPATGQVKSICNHFKGNSPYATGRNIWNFLHREIKYTPDGLSNQNIKFPSRLLADGNGDCKSYALFTAAILNCLGIPFKMRYTSYDPADNTPTHVYVVFSDGSSVMPLDAVYDEFGREKPYTKKYDLDMKVNYLTGFVEDRPIGGIGDFGDWLKKTWQGTKTVSIAPARGAYLLLLKANVRGWATKLDALLNSPDREKLHDKWYKLGGNFSDLKSAIATGKGKKALFEFNGFVFTSPSGKPIGSLAAALVTAGAVIAALSPLLILAGQWLDKKKAEEERKKAEEETTQGLTFENMMEDFDPAGSVMVEDGQTIQIDRQEGGGGNVIWSTPEGGSPGGGAPQPTTMGIGGNIIPILLLARIGYAVMKGK